MTELDTKQADPVQIRELAVELASLEALQLENGFIEYEAAGAACETAAG